MKSLNFEVIAQGQAVASVNDFCNFSESGPCDMCWGDLSL